MQARALSLAALLAVAAAAPLNIVDVDASADDISSFLQLGTTTGGGLNISSLQIDAGANKEARLIFGSSDKGFTVAQTPAGNLQVRHGDQLSFSVSPNGDMAMFGNLESKGAVRIDGPLSFKGVPQWQIAAIENFRTGANGWSNDTVTTCGYGQDSANEEDKHYLLGGYSKFAGGQTEKSFANLPPHKEVRLTANYHMIDAWSGETAYAKLMDRIVWTDSFNQESSKEGINICGAASPESRFSIPIDVVMPHECTSTCSLSVAFGSTLVGSATEQSWGVSDIMIYIR